MCTFFNRRCCCFRSENSDALLYLKLWYSFYIRVESQRLHENNLAQRRQLMWYVVVVTTTTCRQLGNDTTYDTEKKNPTSHDVTDTSAVSGRRVGKTRKHVVKTNCGRHLKRRHFQLRARAGTPRDATSFPWQRGIQCMVL
jgi:hypothetical protein